MYNIVPNLSNAISIKLLISVKLVKHLKHNGSTLLPKYSKLSQCP